MAQTGLEVVRERVALDLDELSPEAAVELGPFTDMTSNQALVLARVEGMGADAAAFVADVVARAKKLAAPGEEIATALDLMVVLLAKPVLPHLKPSGRVHLQVSPKLAWDEAGVLANGRRLVALAENEGIPRERVALKIPITGSGMRAARTLAETDGVACLGTTLFSVEQAVAAYQARCAYIAPYFNELAVHFEPGTWVQYDPVTAHPMFPVIAEIVATYDTLPRPRPRVLPASIVTAQEALALTALGVDDLTIPSKIVRALAEFQPSQSDANPALPEGQPQKFTQDLLGGELDKSIAADPSVAHRLDYALKTFARCEDKLAEMIQQEMAK